jgi:hypothetical protein
MGCKELPWALADVPQTELSAKHTGRGADTILNLPQHHHPPQHGRRQPSKHGNFFVAAKIACIVKLQIESVGDKPDNAFRTRVFRLDTVFLFDIEAAPW